MDLQYLSMSGWQKFCHNFAKWFKSIPKRFVAWLKSIGRAILSFFEKIGNGFVKFYQMFRYGNWKTRLSYFVMGAGCFLNKQMVRGIALLVVQIAFVLYIVFFGGGYLAKFDTLGDHLQGPIYDEGGLQIGVSDGDNSLLILLFGVVTLVVIVLFIYIYVQNIRNAYANQSLIAGNKSPIGIGGDVKNLLDANFHTTLLAGPILGIMIFTVLPLIFMVLIAFTSYDKQHIPPGNLFTWVGWENFKELFSTGSGISIGETFWKILGWTLTWAIFATFTNYIGGMILALMINKKGVKFKKTLRGMFILTIAVPQFVSLLVISKFLSTEGLINKLLIDWGWITQNIKWLEGKTLTRIVVIVVNMWVGLPYSMLAMSGILMNIPEDMYEAARIDGANKVKMFLKITLPYMLVVTGPYLITQFIGNINNFNVIFLLTGGGPMAPDLQTPAGHTDLLVTWLYNITVNGNYSNYKIGSVIGIMVFIVCSFSSLLMYRYVGSKDKEEVFQ